VALAITSMVAVLGYAFPGVDNWTIQWQGALIIGLIVAFSGGGNSSAVQDALNQLPDMANEARGSVRVTLASASATQLVFNVEWLGQMANTPFPTIEVLGTPTGTTTVNIGETQHGSGIDNRTRDARPAHPSAPTSPGT